MAQVSGVTSGYKGMRKGISLVEMLIAVVLFGVLSTLGFKYFKNFYDTNMASKKARMATVVEQASQLSNAYDIYQQQFGTAPATAADLASDTAKILKELPTMPSEVASGAWTLVTNKSIGGTVANDAVFVLPLTNGTTGGVGSADAKEYCRVLNNMMLSTTPLTDETSYANADGTVPLTAATVYTNLGNAFCTDDAVLSAAGLKLVFVKQIN